TVRQAEQVGEALRQREQVGEALRQREQDLAATAHTAPQRLAQRLLVQFDRFLPLVQQAMRQARSRVLDGRPVAATEKVLSLFEPHTRVVKRGKLGAAVEFGPPLI